MTRTIDPAVVLDRLRHLQRTRYPNVPPNTMLLLYAQQGFLARLDASLHANQFVLRGALSLFIRYGNAARPTQDINLAIRGLPNTTGQIRTVLETLCTTPFADGLRFDPTSIQISPINEAFDYPSVTARLRAILDSSQVTLQLGFSFGNVITPAPIQKGFPALSLNETVSVAVYPLETVITENFAALIEIGEVTTRMKDLYDLHVILGSETFDASTVREALSASFQARGTPAAAIPDILGNEFGEDPTLSTRWGQYLRRTGLQAPSFPDVMALLRAFCTPLLLEGQSQGHWRSGAWTR